MIKFIKMSSHKKHPFQYSGHERHEKKPGVSLEMGPVSSNHMANTKSWLVGYHKQKVVFHQD